MKRRWKIGLALGVAGLIAAGWILLGHSREPRYEGKPVSYWFKRYCQTEVFLHLGFNEAEGAEALRRLGTNALPYLVGQALGTKRDTTLRKNYYKLLEKLPASWNAPKFVSYDHIRELAIEAIGEINPPADVILPLVQKALVSRNEEQRGNALEILSNVKEGREMLVPSFKRALHDLDPELREMGVNYFDSMGPVAKTVIPDLTEVLKNDGSGEEPSLGLMAAEVLGNLGPEAAPAVPVLKEVFEHKTNWEERVVLATALCQIDGRQTNVLNFIRHGLKSSGPPDSSYGAPDSPVHADYRLLSLQLGSQARYAAGQLGRIGTNAAPAIPDLMEALDGTNALVWVEAGPALKSMGAPKESYLPKLEGKLKLANDLQRARLAMSLMKVDPGNQPAQAALIELIRKGSPFGGIPLDTWNGHERPPHEAIPILQEALKSGNASWRATAYAILKMIEAREKGK